ncbi:hypothetical protein NPIL_519731 [Nephila pilipes]|uniref:Uncharacterized protein n=1 Tax=Nephila pilipes TaxID=299642 RepID=A0A8X6TM68_NEPPI|nr:hypothetical protein NPIL_519731 [Nephila pilipes]
MCRLYDNLYDHQNMPLRVEDYRERVVTQCYNYNLFHYSANSCHMVARCLKCGIAYLTIDCEIKEKLTNPESSVSTAVNKITSSHGLRFVAAFPYDNPRASNRSLIQF